MNTESIEYFMKHFPLRTSSDQWLIQILSSTTPYIPQIKILQGSDIGMTGPMSIDELLQKDLGAYRKLLGIESVLAYNKIVAQLELCGARDRALAVSDLMITEHSHLDALLLFSTTSLLRYFIPKEDDGLKPGRLVYPHQYFVLGCK